MTNTDTDGIPDTFETTGMKTSNGTIYYANPSKADTDGDGLLDGDEIIMNVKYMSGSGIPSDVINGTRGYYFIRISIPTEVDSDGDGLLDYSTIENNYGVILAPTDPTPMVKTGPTNLWKKQVGISLNTTIPSELGDWYKIEYNIHDKIKYGQLYDAYWLASQVSSGIRSPILTALGSRLLNFRMDSMNIAMHSQVKMLQKVGGFNHVCDVAFYIGTLSNMNQEQFYFQDSANEKYVLWIWRGDYLNLGGGVEMGLYTNPHDVLGVEHWDFVDFELPMTLSLYDYSNNNVNPETIFRWAPTEKQWWITSFKPDFTTPDQSKMAIVGSVDFSENTEMYRTFKENYLNNEILGKYVVFDDVKHAVWIMWWRENVK